MRGLRNHFYYQSISNIHYLLGTYLYILNQSES